MFSLGTPGLLLYPIFAPETGIFWAGNTTEAWMKFGISLAGFVVIILWNLFW